MTAPPPSERRRRGKHPVANALIPYLDPIEGPILEYHAQGGSTRQLLKWINTVVKSPIEIGVQTFYYWLHDTDPRGPEGVKTGVPGPRWELWQEARRQGAQSLVDEAREIVDGIPMFAEITDVAVAKLRVEQRRWEAERMNHQDFGRQEKAQALAINVNVLHLTATQGANAHRLPEQRHGERGITYSFTDASAHHAALPPAPDDDPRYDASLLE